MEPLRSAFFFACFFFSCNRCSFARFALDIHTTPAHVQCGESAGELDLHTPGPSVASLKRYTYNCFTFFCCSTEGSLSCFVASRSICSAAQKRMCVCVRASEGERSQQLLWQPQQHKNHEDEAILFPQKRGRTTQKCCSLCSPR